MFKRISLSKRIMLVLSLVGLMAIAAVPALAQPFFFNNGVPNNGFFFNQPQPFNNGQSGVSQGFRESNIRSGSANPTFTFDNSGNNVNACPTVSQVANTGNVANEQGVTQYNTDTGDIDFGGSSINIAPTTDSSCTQSIDQSATDGWSW
ncbi:MAG: hypothetical protein JOZ19_02970 [Rubrobacter sp.]|nr:hypothetical protein [Rubrobacter sp.]